MTSQWDRGSIIWSKAIVANGPGPGSMRPNTNIPQEWKNVGKESEGLMVFTYSPQILIASIPLPLLIVVAK